MAGFSELNEQQLDRLSDDELIEYIREARRASRGDAERLAVQILVWGHRENLRRRVSIKVPREDVDDVADEALVSAVGAVFSSATVGEFRSWLNTIVDRRIADYHKRRRIHTEPLPEEHEGDEEVWQRKGAPTIPGPAHRVESRMLIEEATRELSEPHRRVVELRRLYGYSAKDAAVEVNNHFGDRLDTPMREDNVHQICSRFDGSLRAIIESAQGQESVAGADAPRNHAPHGDSEEGA